MKCEMTEEMKGTYETLRSLATENAVVVFSLSTCCMCHVVKKLLFGLGVGPTIVEMDQAEGGKEMQEMLEKLIWGDGVKGTTMVVPAVFVGGKYLGGVGTVMSYHINGTLVPLLKKAGGLWL
ncbi:hypothetical protein ACHQM5_018028 [Ranunculus cassubicifolius]